jgi:hypothetical protein
VEKLFEPSESCLKEKSKNEINESHVSKKYSTQGCKKKESKTPEHLFCEEAFKRTFHKTTAKWNNQRKMDKNT